MRLAVIIRKDGGSISAIHPLPTPRGHRAPRPRGRLLVTALLLSGPEADIVRPTKTFVVRLSVRLLRTRRLRPHCEARLPGYGTLPRVAGKSDYMTVDAATVAPLEVLTQDWPEDLAARYRQCMPGYFHPAVFPHTIVASMVLLRASASHQRPTNRWTTGAFHRAYPTLRPGCAIVLPLIRLSRDEMV